MENLGKEILSKIDSFRVELTENVTKGNKAAGTRARKLTIELERLFKQYRKESVESAKK